jgi:hypothetical protein
MTAPMHYVEPPDCPEGKTLAAWRAERRCDAPPRGLRARLRALRGRRRAGARHD